MASIDFIDIWEKTLKVLEKNIGKNSIDKWVSCFKPVGFYNNTFIIEVPNNFSRDFLKDRYAP